MVKTVSLLQHLTATDVKHIKSGRQYFSKMRLVVDKIKRLGVVAGVNTKPKTSAQVLALYEATKDSIVTETTAKNQV
eukprot:10941055-Ditylum_brightwellii.AAC.1